MQALLRIAVVSLFALGVVQAQPLLDREELRKIPPDDAIVLNLSGEWVLGLTEPDPLPDDAVEMQRVDGHLRLSIADAGGQGDWYRRLALPFDPVRYPIAILAYRATGIMPSATALLQLPCTDAPSIMLLQLGDVIADGTIHEIVMDLRELDRQGAIRALLLRMHCRGPEPAVFELLGLRFESDGEMPRAEPRDKAELSLRVLDHDGKPIPGATVTVDGERLNASRSTRTNAEGRASVHAMGNAEGKHSVRIAKEGMAPIEFITSQKRGLPETATLLAASSCGGVVQNEAGAPVPRATVSLVVYAETPMWFGRPYRSVKALTDANGRWRTPLLPVEDVSVQVELEHPDYAGGRASAPTLAELRAGRAVLTITAGCCLRGRVVDPDGKPVPNVRLVLAKSGYDDMGKKELTTGADGRFAFEERVSGRKVLSVIPKAFAPVGFPLQMTTGMDDLTIRLRPGQPLRGRVVDCEGQPVSDVTLRAEFPYYRRLARWRGKTDDDGQFVWPHAPEGNAPYLIFHKKGYMALTECQLQANETEHTITLPPILRISGTVRDADTGEPIPNCTVMHGAAMARALGGHPAPSWYEAAQKSADGTYAVESDMGLYGSLGAVKAMAEGYQAGMVSGIPLTAGDHRVDIRLHRGGPLEGTVLLPNGKPAAGADVTLFEEGQGHMIYDDDAPTRISIKTGSNGRYRFPSVPGKYLLLAIHPDGSCKADKTAHDESPDLRLRPWGALVGVLQNGDQPVTNARVSVQMRSGGPKPEDAQAYYALTCQTDVAGSFRFDRVPPGVGSLGVFLATPEDGEYGNLRQTVYQVAPGETVHAFLGGTGRPVAGRVALPEGGMAKDGTQKGFGSLKGTPDAPLAVPVPGQFLELAIPEQRRQLLAWLKTPEGKAYLAALPRPPGDKDHPPCHFHSSLASDGSLRITDIPAGTYKLSVVSDLPALSSPVQRVSRTIHVPEAPPGQRGETLDLGTLPWNAPE